MYSDDLLLKSIKLAREEAGLTQKKVEEKLGLRPLTLRDYEIGRIKLPLSVAADLANVYGVTLDQLAGRQAHPSTLSPSQFLANFSSIFAGGTHQLILVDPILRAFFDDHRDEFFDHSMFEVLTRKLSKKDGKDLLLDVTKLLYSLAGCDSKIADEEVRTIKYILSAFDMIKSYKMVSPFAVETFQWKTLPKYLESIEIRHFIVWLMFLFANTDGKITTDEVNFIEARAEELKINKSNFLLIHGQFVKGRS